MPVSIINDPSPIHSEISSSVPEWLILHRDDRYQKLIIITGYPSSGKTHRANQLREYFTGRISAVAAAAASSTASSASASASSSSSSSSSSRIARLKLHQVSDLSVGRDRTIYADAGAEKDARAAQLSTVERLLGQDDVVLADGPNYIKGYRYQLYCAAKAASTPSCVIHVGASISTCRAINAGLLADPSVDGGYAEELFDALISRYEEPNGMNRWDRPLFTVLHDDSHPPLDDVWDTVVGQTKTIKPHQATVLRPPTSADHLYDLDRCTQDVLSQILSYQRHHVGEGGGNIPIPVDDAGGMTTTTTNLILPLSPVSVPELQRYRRQFIALHRQPQQQSTMNKGRITQIFVRQLNDQFHPS